MENSTEIEITNVIAALYKFIDEWNCTRECENRKYS